MFKTYKIFYVFQLKFEIKLILLIWKIAQIAF